MIFAATIIWGASFILMKSTAGAIPVFWLLTLRFGSSAVILAVIFIKKLRTLSLRAAGAGALIGACLFTAYVFQTFGITGTTPGRNAFLTAAYCVIVPFLWWIVTGKRPTAATFIAAAGCIVGIGLVSLDSGFSMGLGDGLTLAGALFFALHIVFVSKFSLKYDILLLTVLQFFFSALYSLIFALATETLPASIDPGIIWSLVYLCVLATAVALLFQNIGQKYLPPAAASVILSLESVFGVLFSIIFGYEDLTLRVAAGFIVIFAAVILSQSGIGEKKS